MVVAGFVPADDFGDFCSVRFGESDFDGFVARFWIFELNGAIHMGLIVVAKIFLSRDLESNVDFWTLSFDMLTL